VGLRFTFGHIPFLRGARRYAQDYIFPGGSSDNRLYFGPQITFDPTLEEAEQMLLFDAQTSGGLLLAVPPEKMEALLASAARRGQLLWEIGEVVAGEGIRVDR
jgi:selenide,water dikinase